MYAEINISIPVSIHSHPGYVTFENWQLFGGWSSFSVFLCDGPSYNYL